MIQSVKTIVRRMIFIIPVLLISMNLSAQDNTAYEKAKSEIQETFGTFPAMFKVFPEHALSGAWDGFKQLNSVRL